MSLALNSSICDICCSRAGMEKTNKQCSEFLLTHFGFGFMCIPGFRAREEARSFSTQRLEKKGFSFTILQFCWHPINLTFSASPWCQKMAGICALGANLLSPTQMCKGTSSITITLYILFKKFYLSEDFLRGRPSLFPAFISCLSHLYS